MYNMHGAAVSKGCVITDCHDNTLSGNILAKFYLVTSK